MSPARLAPVHALFVAIVVETAALVVAIAAAGAGHGTYLPAKLLFPYTMLMATADGSITLAGSAVAVLQFPLYVLALAWPRGRSSAALAAIVCAAVHASAAVGALVLSSASFVP